MTGRMRRIGLHSADCVLRSLDFAGIEELQRAGRLHTTELHAEKAVELALSPAPAARG